MRAARLARPGLAAAAACLACAACMRATPGGGLAAPAGPPRADAATIGLWHMDEAGGDRVLDAGPHRLDGVAGTDARADFGRFRSGRAFTRSIESFVYVPYDPALDSPRSIAVEAWVHPLRFGLAESPIAGRWSDLPNEQSWRFGIAATGRLVFAFQPEEAGLPVVHFSAAVVETGRWTHVAAAYDGEVVRFEIDGRLDSQFVVRARIRPSRVPLLIGNSFDTRWLTDFGGKLQIGRGAAPGPFAAFEGRIDELRVSRAAPAEAGGR